MPVVSLCNAVMNVFSEGLGAHWVDFSEDDYLEGISDLYSVRVCTVNNYGTCFFDSIFLLLPTVGEAVESARSLRLACVAFMRECYEGQHGLPGERIKMEIEHACTTKLVSSANRSRAQDVIPGTADKYFEAVSKNSVWVEGFHWLRTVSILFNVNIAVHIYKFDHVIVFGEDDPARPRIAVWKSDVETHFEPLIPINCKCTCVIVLVLLCTQIVSVLV